MPLSPKRRTRFEVAIEKSQRLSFVRLFKNVDKKHQKTFILNLGMDPLIENMELEPQCISAVSFINYIIIW